MPEQERDSDFLKMVVPVGKLLPWCGIALVAVVAATFEITRLGASDREAALETRLAAKSEDIRRLESRSLPSASSLPGVTLDDALDLPELRELAARVADLEAERSQLLSELVSRAEASLDPTSELAGLLRELDSSEEDSQDQALAGLFELRDPRSFSALVSYFAKDPDRATRRFTITEWLDLLWRLDPLGGMEFTIRVLDADDQLNSRYSYLKLRSDLDDLALLDGARAPLEQLALRSESTLARTRAKLLLEGLPQRRAKLERANEAEAEYERQLTERGEAADRRNIPEVLRDIEEAISELAEEKSEPK